MVRWDWSIQGWARAGPEGFWELHGQAWTHGIHHCCVSQVTPTGVWAILRPVVKGGKTRLGSWTKLLLWVQAENRWHLKSNTGENISNGQRFKWWPSLPVCVEREMAWVLEYMWTLGQWKMIWLAIKGFVETKIGRSVKGWGMYGIWWAWSVSIFISHVSITPVLAQWVYEQKGYGGRDESHD